MNLFQMGTAAEIDRLKKKMRKNYLEMCEREAELPCGVKMAGQLLSVSEPKRIVNECILRLREIDPNAKDLKEIS